jgi:tRNA (5-methylaminomethyl-2-thiouridylate)-methyltransferase (EC 2.1.1.61)
MTAHVIVGLSGGVDSAVSALLLREQGLRVSGLFMVNWTEDEAGYCSAADDYAAARAVAEELDIPLHRVDFSAEYRERVFAQFLAEYRAGRTPNPDLLCNREIKFAPFVEHARRLGADLVATGHYARIDPAADGPRLLRAADEAKDQTYFLALVHRAQLRDVRFPLGELHKREVREIARRAGLPNHQRRDSTGICFIGERPFADFLGRYLDQQPGPIEDEHGRRLGTHRGLPFYTLGQRRGLALGGVSGAAEAPWYVIAKDSERNALLVAQDSQHPRLMSRRLQTAPFHWIRRPDTLDARFLARLRHRQPLAACRVEELADGSLQFTFEQAQRAATPGQFAALYADEECLGAAPIQKIVSDTIFWMGAASSTL